MEPALIESALSDPEAGVRENAIRLAETHLKDEPRWPLPFEAGERSFAEGTFPTCCAPWVSSIPLRHELAQNQLLLGGLEDEWMQLAALSASSDRAVQYFDMASARRPELTAESKATRAVPFCVKWVL